MALFPVPTHFAPSGGRRGSHPYGGDQELPAKQGGDQHEEAGAQVKEQEKIKG